MVGALEGADQWCLMDGSGNLSVQATSAQPALFTRSAGLCGRRHARRGPAG